MERQDVLGAAIKEETEALTSHLLMRSINSNVHTRQLNEQIAQLHEENQRLSERVAELEDQIAASHPDLTPETVEGDVEGSS